MSCSCDSLLRYATEKLQIAFSKLKLDARARLESELLLAHILQVSRVFLHTHPEKTLSDSQKEQFLSLIEQRAQGKPIEYLTLKAQFYSQEFAIQEGVLIPRPETEILVDKAHQLIIQQNLHSIAEVGVGSGVITIMLASFHPHKHFLATDINPKALELTESNIATHIKDADITLAHCSLLECLPQMPHFQPQIIISNPPYIAHNECLQKPLSFEPTNALFAGQDGLEILKLLIQESARLKVWLLCEIGYRQKSSLEHILRKYHAKNVCFYKDLSGLDRGFVAYFGD